MGVLFVHGAGGYLDDQSIAAGLGAALRTSVDLPRLPEEDMSVEAWAAPVRDRLAGLAPEDLVVGHSFGATILHRVLAERPWAPISALLLAMPDWSPRGWDVAEYVYDGPEPGTAITLHHCRDDQVVPFDHLALHAARLPGARVVEHPTGGHQFEGCVDAIARDALGRE